MFMPCDFFTVESYLDKPVKACMEHAKQADLTQARVKVTFYNHGEKVERKSEIILYARGKDSLFPCPMGATLKSTEMALVARESG